QATVDIQGATGSTALLEARRPGLSDMIELLLRAGATPHRYDKSGQTPLAMASLLDNAKIVGDLLVAGAPVTMTLCLAQTQRAFRRCPAICSAHDTTDSGRW